MARHRSRWFAVTILSVAMVSACSDAATTPQNPPRSPTSEANSNRETVSVQLRSEATDLSTVGPDGRRVFGWNLLTGESSFLGDTVQVRLQGSVEYLDGSGPFGGFLRIVAEDSSQVALEVNGQATSGPDGTDFDGRMGFLGASGRYSDVITAGRFTGVRSAELGSPVEVTLDLLVERVTPESGQ